MASGKYATEDELLRDALEALDAEAIELEAIQATITEWHAGDPGVPLNDAFDQIRRRHNVTTYACVIVLLFGDSPFKTLTRHTFGRRALLPKLPLVG